MEALRRDLQADEDEDRQDRRTGNDLIEIGKRAGEAGGADEGCRGERVSRPAPHRLVGGVADVGGGLDHAATGPRHDRGDRLHADDLAGGIVVAGGGGALGAVDPSHHGAQGKGNHNRQIFERVGPGLQPLQAQRGEPFTRPQRRLRIDR